MSKKMKKQIISKEDHSSLRYRHGEGKEALFASLDYEIASILLELSHPVVFSSDYPLFTKWGRTKKRYISDFMHLPEISPEPEMKSLMSMEVGEMGSTSSSSCLTGEAKKTNPHIIKKGLEEEFSTKNQGSSQPNTSCSVLEIQAEMGLFREQVGLVAQPIRDDQNLRHPQPPANVSDNLEQRAFDLNLPAAEEGNRIAPMVGFQRVATEVQAAAQARQRRLGLIRSKKVYSRCISSYQFK